MIATDSCSFNATLRMPMPKNAKVLEDNKTLTVQGVQLDEIAEVGIDLHTKAYDNLTRLPILRGKYLLWEKMVNSVPDQYCTREDQTTRIGRH
jgi:hypothetical protein